jgi:hypothetical protein
MLCAEAYRNRTVGGSDNQMEDEATIDGLLRKYPWWSPLGADGRTSETDTGASKPKSIFEGKNTFV